MEKTYAKGYIDRNTCLDGTNSHNYEDKTMSDDGVQYHVRCCSKCGWWY